jgi:hypothetical protein
MAFDGTDIQIDVVQHSTNRLGHGHQTMNDQTHSQYNQNHAMAQTTFAGKVQHAQLSSSETINQRHRSEIMPMRESFEDDLRLSTNTFSETQETVANHVAQPASGIGAQINPTV